MMRFTYKAKPWVMLLCLAFFVPATAYSAHIALTIDESIRVRGLGTFTAEQAPFVFWFFFGALGVMSLLGVALLLFGIFSKQQLVLTDQGISVPKNRFRRGNDFVPYDTIVDLSLVSVASSKFLTIRHDFGQFQVAASMRYGSSFDTIVNELTNRVAQARGSEEFDSEAAVSRV